MAIKDLSLTKQLKMILEINLINLLYIIRGGAIS